jgi:hypothetical protein
MMKTDLFRTAYCQIMHPGQHDNGPYCTNNHADAIAQRYLQLINDERARDETDDEALEEKPKLKSLMKRPAPWDI